MWTQLIQLAQVTKLKIIKNSSKKFKIIFLFRFILILIKFINIKVNSKHGYSFTDYLGASCGKLSDLNMVGVKITSQIVQTSGLCEVYFY